MYGGGAAPSQYPRGCGGDASAYSTELSSDVVSVTGARQAFAALKSDGSVIAWGDSHYGGVLGVDNNGYDSQIAANLSSGVTEVFSNRYAFAALKTDGSIVSWGASTDGAVLPNSGIDLSSGVTTIFSKVSSSAFVALKSDGSIIPWGGGGLALIVIAFLTITE